MADQTYRLYSDLAWLWPMWGDASEYAQYCEHIIRLIRQHAQREVHSLLNLGCGVGKNVFNLKQEFAVTGLDISPAMLDLARRLNPECCFVQADMRTFSLAERFDAILIDDAIAYMTTEADFDVEKARLVGAFMIVNAGDLDRVSGITQLEEFYAFDDSSGFDIEAGDDSFCQHFRLLV